MAIGKEEYLTARRKVNILPSPFKPGESNPDGGVRREASSF